MIPGDGAHRAFSLTLNPGRVREHAWSFCGTWSLPEISEFRERNAMRTPAVYAIPPAVLRTDPGVTG